MAVFELKSSLFFSAVAFDEAFVGRTIVAGFADAKGNSKNCYLYAVYDFPYKIEFAFDLDGALQYVMVEECGAVDCATKKQCVFIDDLQVFGKSDKELAEEMPSLIDDDGLLHNDTAQLWYEAGKLQSMYFITWEIRKVEIRK